MKGREREKELKRREREMTRREGGNEEERGS